MSSPILRHNLARFAFRQQQESEKLRAKIYDKLRVRFYTSLASPEGLETVARDRSDTYAIALLEFARCLLVSNSALINAQLKVRK